MANNTKNLFIPWETYFICLGENLIKVLNNSRRITVAVERKTTRNPQRLISQQTEAVERKI